MYKSLQNTGISKVWYVARSILETTVVEFNCIECTLYNDFGGLILGQASLLPLSIPNDLVRGGVGVQYRDFIGKTPLLQTPSQGRGSYRSTSLRHLPVRKTKVLSAAAVHLNFHS